jgi:hypothetical protein
MTSRGPYRRHSTPFQLQLCKTFAPVSSGGAMRNKATTSLPT